ncbi:alpha/beta-hydrolase [Agrocybe pediades]|nr:alpha/beta-hydrolase [Agrocybe pediades]
MTMTKTQTIEERNRLSFFDKIRMLLVAIPAPFVFIWTLLKAPFHPYGRAKSWKRILADRALLRIISCMNRRQQRVVFGTTRGLYDQYVKNKGLPHVVENIGAGANLLWIGPRRTDRVMLYLHGGAFLLAAPAGAPLFWRFVQESLEKRGKPTGLAMLEYTLIPDAPYPTQLKQTILAIQHILDSGVKPENIQLVGDSAGGVLIHGVLSHLLHPLEGLPKLELSSPLGGGYMLSIWAKMVDERGSLYTNDGNGDFLDGRSLNYWGRKVLDGVPASVIPYLEPNNVPEGWLSGADRYMKRLLISAGGVEALRDEIIKYAAVVEKYHKDVTFIVQENGAHNDPYTDFLVGEAEKDLGNLTPIVIEWIEKSFP